jgi:hypothetical protein
MLLLSGIITPPNPKTPLELVSLRSGLSSILQISDAHGVPGYATSIRAVVRK